MIKFLCPNGHPLSAPENLAGKPGKCPKCSTPFVVPKPDEATAVPAAAGVAAAESAPSAGSSEPQLSAPASPMSGGVAGGSSPAIEMPAMGSGKNLPAGETFVFLCPNGHKLNGPPSMMGKPGQCPHCGARFRIPSDDDLELPEDEEVPTGEADDELPEDEEIPEGQPADDDGGPDFDRLFGGQPDDSIAPPPPGAAGLGYVVGRLWEQRTDETELEVFLTEGEIIAPDYFSEVLSSSDYGVFAIQESDGSYAVTVIPWSAVRRVGMRRITELPGQLFS